MFVRTIRLIRFTAVLGRGIMIYGAEPSIQFDNALRDAGFSMLTSADPEFDLEAKKLLGDYSAVR